MAVSLIAVQALVYDSHRIAKGARFSARTSSDAHILKLLGKATEPPTPVVAPASWTPPPDNAVVGIDLAEDVTQPDPPKRRYRRRDLTADPA